MNKNNVYSYEIDGKLYINLTNKCSNSCEFCVRQKDAYEGYFLWLDNEPSVLDVINSVQDLDKYAEVVFCGYGEPTFKIDEVVELGKYFKSKGKITRLNTNGHGSKINGRDISSDLIGAIDVVSISLNQSDAKKYQQICHSIYKEEGFEILLDFAKACVNRGIKTYLSIVAVEGVDVEKCCEVAAKTGAVLKVREYIDVK